MNSWKAETHTRRCLTFRHSGLLRTTVPVDLIESVSERSDGTCRITLVSGRMHDTDGPATFDEITNAIAPTHEHQT